MENCLKKEKKLNLVYGLAYMIILVTIMIGLSYIALPERQWKKETPLLGRTSSGASGWFGFISVLFCFVLHFVYKYKQKYRPI